MKIASMIARYLLGLGFVVFGLNGFLNFIPQPPMPPSLALDFLKAVSASHYMMPICAFQLVGGLLLLANRYVPLALTILGPILVNILIFHITMQPATLPMACVFVVFWILVFIRVRSAFDGIFQNRGAA